MSQQTIEMERRVEVIQAPVRRIGLRPITKADTTFVVELRNSPEVAKWFYSDNPITPQGHERFLKRLPDNARLYIAHRLEDEIPVGMVGLVNIDQHHHHAEFGRFVVAPRAQGKGYGREILLLILHHSFEELNLRRLFLDVFAHNQTAINNYRWAGFVEEGRLRNHLFKDGVYHDVIIMGLLRDEYLERRQKLAQDLGLELE